VPAQRNPWKWLKERFAPKPPSSPELQRAIALIKAVDEGGMPLDAGRVNAIARSLGLEVSRSARVEQTVQRIRQALARRPG
jgi:hypothetical protein